jgi:hypothetical protein
MNVDLVRRRLQAPPPPVAVETAAVSEPTEEWWGVYYRGEKIGYATQRVTPTDDGYVVEDASLFRLNLLGRSQTADTRLRMIAGPDWELKRFHFRLISSDIRFETTGEIVDRKLTLEIVSGGERTRRELDLRQRPYLHAAVKPYAISQNLEPGKEQLLPIFDPATLSQQVATVVVEGRERIRVGDATESAIRLRQRFKGITIISWVDGRGRTLREETPTGLSMVRESPEQARKAPGNRAILLDLVREASIPVASPIAAPGEKNLLKVELSGVPLDDFSLDGGRQRLAGNVLEIRREGLSAARSYRLPLRESGFVTHLQPTPFVQSDHPKIRALTAKVLNGETDAIKAVARLREWVYAELDKTPTVSIPSALDVLATRKGDCNEHTVLFNAMARAAGIPAKTVVGVVYLKGAFFYHAWSQVWLGEWISVDSVLNQFPADVTHLKFLEGEIDRQIDILQLIGQLKIKVLEAL